jgi:hypothetical protein
MNVLNAIATLTKYNEWRRGANIPQPAPASIGRAIESVCEAAARYEALRLLNVRQFVELKERNLSGENFDTMVDELVKARAEE